MTGKENSDSNIVFTGSLSMPRREAILMAESAGYRVSGSVTTATAMLVIGVQNEDRLKGHSKSGKQRKAETMNDSGSDIRIMTEDEFIALVGTG